MTREDITAPGGGEFSERTFDGLDLKGAEVSSASFYACVFRRCDLTGASLRFCRFRDCRFESCNLSLAGTGASVFDGVEFRDSKLAGVNWTEADWKKPRLSGPPAFRNCVLTDCSFLGLELGGAVFRDCLAREADFREAGLAGADFSGTDLAGALFGGTDLRRADLSGARNYAVNPAENRVKGARFSLPEAMSLLHCLDIKLV